MEKIRVYIIDDHKLFVEGIYSLISEETDLEVTGYSLLARDYLAKADQVGADVYLVDINMPEISGIELTHMIRERDPDAHVLALSMYDDIQFVEKMIRSGAIGYIQKAASMEELIKAIRTVAKGEKYLAQDIQDTVFSTLGNLSKLQDPEEPENRLTRRELEVLQLIAKDYSTAEIADKLFISERTVETHRKNIFSKTDARTVIGLIRYAVKHGIINLDDHSAG